MNVCYACGREVSWAWEYICPVHGKGVMICTQERWNELQELRRLLRIEDAARKVLSDLKVFRNAVSKAGMITPLWTNDCIDALAAALEEE